MTTPAANPALLVTVQRLLASQLSPDDLMAQVVTLVGEAFEYIDVGLLLVDPARPDVLVLRASNYPGFPDAVGTFRQSRSGGIIGRALSSGLPVLVADVRQDPDYLPLPGVPVMAELAVPIRVDDAVAGVLNVESLHPISPDEAAAVATVATLLGAALEAHGR